MAEVDEKIGDETVAMSVVLQKLSRKALMTVKNLMGSSNEHVALKAASDILDRNTETSKTLKAQVTSYHISSDDAQALAKALTEGAQARQKFLPSSTGDVVKTELEAPTNGKSSRPKAQDGSEHHEEHSEGSEEQDRGNGRSARGQTPAEGDEQDRDDAGVLT